MTPQELLDYSKEMLSRGERYTTIAQFLKKQNADDLTTQVIFKELDKIEKEKKSGANESNAIVISWGQFFIGCFLTICAVYYSILGFKAGRISTWLLMLGVAGTIMFLREGAKLVIKVTRK